MPKRVPTVEWKLLESQEEIQDGIRVRRKELVGRGGQPRLSSGAGWHTDAAHRSRNESFVRRP